MSDPEVYAVRLHRLASDDIDEVQARLMASVGEEYAEEWHEGLLSVLATPATYPERCVLAHENRLFRNDVRVCPFRHRGSSVTHRILYEIVVNDMEAPYVHVLHVRRGARKPMTRTEARKIEE